MALATRHKTNAPLERLLTVREASEALGLTEWRTRRLLSEGKLALRKVGRRTYVPLPAIADYQRARREYESKLRAAVPLDWDWEGNLVARLAAWFRDQGWQEVSRADAALREHGIDLVVEKDGRTQVIEVKGWPSAKHATVAKAGQEKRWTSTMARNYFGDLVLAAMLLRSSRPNDEIAIAVPARETFTTLLDKVRSSLESLGVGAYVIDGQGEISTFIAVEDVDRGRLERQRAIDRAEIRRLLDLPEAEREKRFVSSSKAAHKMLENAARSK